MAFIVDTSAYSAVYRGQDDSMATWFQSSELLFMPFVVLAELRAGFKVGAKEAENIQLLNRFLNSENVQVLYPTDETTLHYAQIFSALRAKGRPIGTNDIWIAALCLEHSIPLLTKDSDFTHIDGLEVFGAK